VTSVAAAFRRSAFCQFYRRWEKRLERSMRQLHFAGEKPFVDYAGRPVPIHGSGGVDGQRFAFALPAGLQPESKQ